MIAILMSKQLKLMIKKVKRKLKINMLSRTTLLTQKNLMSLSLSMIKFNRNQKKLLKFYNSSLKKK